MKMLEEQIYLEELLLQLMQVLLMIEKTNSPSIDVHVMSRCQIYRGVQAGLWQTIAKPDS